MKAFLAILQYLPFILQGIVAVQAAIPTAPGATKKQVVLNAITAAASVGEQIPEAHIQGISKLIDLTVADLHTTNQAGFGTSSVTVPTTTVK